MSPSAGRRAPEPPAWEARFRAPRTLWVRAAKDRPERGIACTNVTGVFQLHRWPVGEPIGEALTAFPTGKGAGWISPDGEWVVWHADRDGNEVGHFVAAPWAGGPEIDLTPDLPAYASFAAGFGPDGAFAASIIGSDRVQVAIVPLASDGPASPTLLDPGPGFLTGLALGSSALAYATTAGRGLSTVLRILDRGSGELLTEVDHAPGAISVVGYADDGRLLASTTRSGETRPLVVEPDGTVREIELDLPGDLFPVSVAPDGRTALLVGSHRSAERLHVVDLQTGACRGLDRLTGTYTGGAGGAGTFIRCDGSIVVTREDATTLPEVLLVDPADGAARQVLVQAAEAPPSRPFRSVDIPSSDGAVVQGWLGVPDGDGPFPTILDVHGGPQANESDRFFPDAQAWLDRGFAFLTLNYRGSTGFGREYEQAIWGRPGRCELDDMVAARTWLIGEGIADPRRIVPHGGSYGGYLTLLALGRRPDLWATGVALVAIADWRLLYEDGENLRDYQVALFGGTPDQTPVVHAEASPITYLEQVRAPLLVIQGRNDSRCPSRQMEVYVARARQLGKALEIDWFDAGHGHGATDTRIAWCRRSIEFVERALGLDDRPAL